MKKSFKYWTRDALHQELGLNRMSQSPELAFLLNSNEVIEESEQIFLARLAKKSDDYIDSWNEVELREKFIYKVTDLVDFDMSAYQCTFFAERYLTATVQHVTLYGYADWMVSAGLTKPTHPYFFMHEYKPEGEKQIDGRGQLLALMLATQALNKDNYPVYGCFIHGRMWFFVVLKDLQYDISRAYISTQINDLQEIVKILKKQKEMILERIKK
jgi:hypothetical protein